MESLLKTKLIAKKDSDSEKPINLIAFINLWAIITKWVIYIKAAKSCDLVKTMLAVSPYRDDLLPTSQVWAGLGA